MGNGRHIRTVPVPDWVKAALDDWTKAAGVGDGRVSRKGSVWGNGITGKVIWHIVKACAKRAGIQQLAPHDRCRSYARLCHATGGELEQIQFLLGHVSVETTERYLGCEQRLRQAGERQDRSGALNTTGAGGKPGWRLLSGRPTFLEGTMESDVALPDIAFAEVRAQNQDVREQPPLSWSSIQFARRAAERTGAVVHGELKRRFSSLATVAILMNQGRDIAVSAVNTAFARELRAQWPPQPQK